MRPTRTLTPIEASTLKVARISRILSIIGVIVSAPFILLVGIGLVVTIPLSLFLWMNNRLIKNIKNPSQAPVFRYRLFVTFSILSGIGSAFGFSMLWGISHGIDVKTTPFAPFLAMVPISPLISWYLIRSCRKWKNSLSSK